MDADDKASEYQRLHGKAHPFVLMSPHAGAVETIPEGTITAKVVQELRNYATGPPLRQYIQEKNHWTDRTMGAINWSAHKNALTSVLSEQVYVTKLVHKVLPT